MSDPIEGIIPLEVALDMVLAPMGIRYERDGQQVRDQLRAHGCGRADVAGDDRAQHRRLTFADARGAPLSEIHIDLFIINTILKITCGPLTWVRLAFAGLQSPSPL